MSAAAERHSWMGHPLGRLPDAELGAILNVLEETALGGRVARRGVLTRQQVMERIVYLDTLMDRRRQDALDRRAEPATAPADAGSELVT